MEKINLTCLEFEGLTILSDDMLLNIEGGDFWGDVGYALGYLAGSIVKSYHEAAAVTQTVAF